MRRVIPFALTLLLLLSMSVIPVAADNHSEEPSPSASVEPAETPSPLDNVFQGIIYNEAGTQGVEGVQVAVIPVGLTPGEGEFLQVTDVSGSFRFENLPHDTYGIRVSNNIIGGSDGLFQIASGDRINLNYALGEECCVGNQLNKTDISAPVDSGESGEEPFPSLPAELLAIMENPILYGVLYNTGRQYDSNLFNIVNDDGIGLGFISVLIFLVIFLFTLALGAFTVYRLMAFPSLDKLKDPEDEDDWIPSKDSN